MSKKTVHVVPHPEGWAVKVGGNQRATKVTDTQREAIELGKERAIKLQTELMIHGENGRIRSNDSYGPDPNPPKDKEH